MFLRFLLIGFKISSYRPEGHNNIAIKSVFEQYNNNSNNKKRKNTNENIFFDKEGKT